jgi:hypothetical protein
MDHRYTTYLSTHKIPNDYDFLDDYGTDERIEAPNAFLQRINAFLPNTIPRKRVTHESLYIVSAPMSLSSQTWLHAFIERHANVI